MKPYPQYKDSGVEWIGEVPEGWDVWKLAHAYKEIGSGTTPPSSEAEWYGGNIPWVTTGELKENLIINTEKNITEDAITNYPTLRIYPKNSIVIAMYGATIGRLGILGLEATTNQACCVLPISEVFINKFVFYWLIAFRNRIVALSSGGGQPNINQEKISSLKLATPRQNEQTTIAAFLDRKTAETDSIIAKKERLVELYEEEKAAVINHAVTKGLHPDAKMKDSGIEWLGEIPEHWEVKKLKHLVCKIGSGVTPKGGASVYQQSGIPLLRSQNIHFDGLRLDDVAYITDEIHNDMSGSKVLSGDVLLNITGASIGRCYFVDDKLGEANVNQHVCIIRPLKGFITKFIYFLLCSNIGQIQIDLEQTGGGREGLNFEALSSFVIPAVNEEEQTAIVQHIETKRSRIDAIISKFKRQIELLKEYRTALISEAVTGKIDVRNQI